VTEGVGLERPSADETPLPTRVRTRVVELASDALGRMTPPALPGSLTRVASFAPARRAKLAADRIAAVLATDEDFRSEVAADAASRAPELAEAVKGAQVPAAADPVEVAALAYLLRPPGWQGLLEETASALRPPPRDEGETAAREVEQLRRQVESLTRATKESRAQHREKLAELKAENAELRHKLGDARTRLRQAESTAEAAAAEANELRAGGEALDARHEAELRRLRTRIEGLERELGSVRRTERAERGGEQLRARLLLDTLLDTAQGLRRELALPAVEGVPADAVEAHLAEQGTRSSSGHGSLGSDDPALLEQVLMLPRAHMIVDGYNVTKTAWPELSLQRQRDLLLSGVAPLVARTGAEVTVVFDAAETSERPVVNRPRGVRVLYSASGVIADDVIRELVAAEPRGRPVVVVTTDAEVVEDVRRAGARVCAAEALARLLRRS
jgi:predicted RNA-binding protein with PIN domain